MSVCSNCGNQGHFFRECKEPITSLGLIIFRRCNGKEKEWLLIRRRVSIGFIEILRGKYEPRDSSGLLALINQTTLTEREKLLSQTFTELWKNLWNGTVTRRYMAEYEHAKAKFDVIRNRGTLSASVAAAATAWTEPEWGFPKGRRSSTETEYACALRETEEETGISKKLLRILEDESSLLEEYVGSNGIRYRHKYWLAEAPSDLEVRVDPDNEEQIREISDVRWCSLEQAMSLIRPYSEEKRTVLSQAAARLLGKKIGSLKAEE